MENRMYEKQQLVSEEEETAGGVTEQNRSGGGTQSLSPAPSSSIHSTRAVQPTPPQSTTRVAYVSERRPLRGTRRAQATFHVAPTTASLTAYGASRQDAKRTQADLLRLLAEFSSPEASRATQQLADIRQQQDDLARLHFKLGSDPDAPAKPASSRETMARLVRSLEQLSTSIEQLRTFADQVEPNGPKANT